jgi:ribosomal RNA-processing protein 36
MRKAAPHSERHTFPVSDTSSSMERSERDIPLEERLRMKRSGFATYEESAGGAGDASSAAAGSRAGSEKRYKPREEVVHRANKNRPLELTSKRAVGRFRQAVEVKRRKSVDPRFESVSGRLNEDLFSKAYSFVDDYKVRRLRGRKEASSSCY